MNKSIYIFLLFIFLTGCKSEKQQLHVYSWASFFTDDIIQEFERQHDCQVVIDTYDSNESLFAKLRLGAAGYDVIVPSNYFVELMRDEGMLEPINHNAIPNRSYIDPALDTMIHASLSQFGVPYMITYTGIGWRNDRIFLQEPSWSIFADTTLKKRMTMLNDPRETIGAGLLYHYYDVNTLNLNQLQEAKETLIQWKANLAKFENEQYKNGIASGEYLVVHAYSGDIVQLMRDDPRISFSAPKEGMTVTVDFLSIPIDARNKPLAHAFINYLLETGPALKNSVYTGLLVLNTNIYRHLPQMMQDIYKPFFTDPGIHHAHLLKYLGEDTHIYNTVWDDIKAQQ